MKPGWNQSRLKRGIQTARARVTHSFPLARTMIPIALSLSHTDLYFFAILYSNFLVCVDYARARLPITRQFHSFS